MNTVGIYLETQDGVIKETNFELATLVRKEGREGVGVLFGADAQAAAETLGPFGLKRILHVTGDAAATFHPEVFADQLAKIIREQGFRDFLGTFSVQGRDLLPRLAALIESPLAVDCIAVDLDKGEATQPVYSGKVHARLKLSGDVRLYALRPNAIGAENSGDSAAEVTQIDATGSVTRLEIREVVKHISRTVDLTEAQIVVSGGHGVGTSENFKLLQDLADVLGAAVGASRRAVDEGMAPYSMQVGQTGKIVNPQLYIACGISGAIQHFAGMKSAKTIVAINKDPDAPILEKAHYSIVGDLHEILPLLTEKLRKVLGK